MGGLTRWVLSHGRLVVLTWVVLTIAGGFAASRISGELTRSFASPGREGFDANAEIAERFGAGGAVPPIALVGGDTKAFERVARAVPGGRLVTDVGAEGAALVFVPPGPGGDDENPAALAAARAAAAKEGVGVTGVTALSEGSAGGEGPGLLIETLLGGVGALVVLAFVFASLLAVVPLLVAAVAILSTFLVLYGLAQLTEVSFVVQFLVGLIGLGVAIDYSLLIVIRWREERSNGREGDEAIEAAMATSGRAVVFSGTTVGVGLLALVVVPVQFIRSIGFGGMLIPLLSVLVCVTLLPILLRRFGERLAWPRRRSEHEASPGWTRWARWVTRRDVLAAAGGLAVIVALAIAALGLRPGDPTLDALATSGPAHDALVALERGGGGAGTLTPIEVVSDGGEAGRLKGELVGVDGVQAVTGGGEQDGRALLHVIPRPDGATEAGAAVRERVGEVVHPAGAVVGGRDAQTADLADAIYSAFPVMVVLIALITFVLLARAFRSILLPLKAVALNVLSVAASWGVITLVWQLGYGSDELFGIPATDAITAWVPLAIFAFLYGLSMDYEVFILARIREEYDETGDTREAVIRGLGRTGRLVTSAALILFLAFVALAASPGTEIKVLATGLAAGIILDATVVRALIVPALVTLFGRWNWWLGPRWARVLRVPRADP